MAAKTAVADGNWSDGATWNGGTVPAAGDAVDLNGHVVTLDTSPPAIASITTAPSFGQLLVSGTRTLHVTGTSTLDVTNSDGVLVSDVTQILTLTVDGGVTVQGSGGGSGLHAENGGVLTCNANVTVSTSDVYGVIVVGGATLTVNGNVTATAAGSTAVNVDGDQVTVNGNVTASGGGTALSTNIDGSPLATISGNVTSTSAGVDAVLMSGNKSRIFIAGDLTGPPSAMAVNMQGNLAAGGGILACRNLTVGTNGSIYLTSGDTLITSGTLTLGTGYTWFNGGLWLHVGTPATLPASPGTHWEIPAPVDVRSGHAYLGTLAEVGALNVPPLQIGA